MFLRFLNYWLKNIKSSKDGFDIFMLVVTVILFIVWGGCKILDFRTPNETDFSNWCLLGAGFFFSFWCFIWLPFSRHESTERFFFNKLKGLESDYDEIKRERDAFRGVTDDKTKRRQTKDYLGTLLIKLETRIRKIESMTIFNYTDLLDENQQDTESTNLIYQIKNYIKDNIGKAESDIFFSPTGLKKGTTINFGKAEQTWNVSLDALRHWATQLKDLIKNYNI